MTGPNLLSIVVPVFNEREVLPLLHDRLDRVLATLDTPAEVIFVDDGSCDGSQEMIRAFVAMDSRYRLVVLSRNYGHQIALTAGLDHARGNAVVVLDADLQDPPELIPAMVAKWREGYHVVYGERQARKGESFVKRRTAVCFYGLIRSLSRVDIPRNVGDFRLMDRQVVDALRRMPERSRFVRGLVAWAGFRQTPILFDRPPRAAGVTKYPWRKMLAFGLDAVFAFSVIPLRLATTMGALVTLLAGVEVVRTLYLRFVVGTTVPGFSAIIVAVLALGGFNLIFLGILGEYVGRLYVEVKARPLYFVQEVVCRQGEHV
jgi:dolichol-phosphate mannosyltransferase